MWDNIEDWNLVLPPSRPGIAELARISKLGLKLRREEPVAVLGSTPEFRDLLHELGFAQIFVFDKAEIFHRRMTALRAYQSDETFVCGDWLETLAAFDEHFSLILSDLTSGNISYEERRDFYALVRNSLRSEGWFVDKVLTNERRLLSLKELRTRYTMAPINLLSANYFSCEALFCSELQLRLGIVDTTQIYSDLRATLKGARFKALIDLTQRVTPTGCVWYYGKAWREVSQEYCQGLLQRREFGLPRHGPYWGRAKQFFMQRP